MLFIVSHKIKPQKPKAQVYKTASERSRAFGPQKTSSSLFHHLYFMKNK